MLAFPTKDEITRRVKAINRNQAWLSRASGVDPMTVARGAKTTERQMKLVAALEQEEIRLRDHLLALHPLPEQRSAA